MASIYDLLRADHAMHIQWLVELQDGLSSSEAEQSFSRLKEAFRVHTEFENGFFTPPFAWHLVLDNSLPTRSVITRRFRSC